MLLDLPSPIHPMVNSMYQNSTEQLVLDLPPSTLCVMAGGKQPSAPLGNQIGEGLDTLWKFQLRKENAALLDKLEENAKAIEACRSENMRHFQEFNERIASIEATIFNIENTEEKASQAWGLQNQEVTALKKKVENLIQTGIPNSKQNILHCTLPKANVS